MESIMDDASKELERLLPAAGATPEQRLEWVFSQLLELQLAEPVRQLPSACLVAWLAGCVCVCVSACSRAPLCV